MLGPASGLLGETMLYKSSADNNVFNLHLKKHRKQDIIVIYQQSLIISARTNLPLFSGALPVLQQSEPVTSVENIYGPAGHF